MNVKESKLKKLRLENKSKIEVKIEVGPTMTFERTFKYSFQIPSKLYEKDIM